MDYSIVTKDGIEILNIPEDIKRDDQRLKDQVAQMRKLGLKSASFGEALEQYPSTAVSNEPEPSKLQQIGESFKGDIGAATRGVVQGATGLVTMIADPLTNLLNIALPPEMKQLPPSEGLKYILDKLGVPEAKTKAQQILQSATTGLTGGAAEVAAGKAMQLVPGFVSGVGKALAQNPLTQLTGGAGAGIGAEVARQSGAGPVGQFAAGLGGSVLGSVAGSKGIGVKPNPEVVDTIKQADAMSTPVMTTDVFPPKTAFGKFAQRTSERIPVVGTGKMRSAQQEARVKDVTNLVKDFDADSITAALDDTMTDMLGKRIDDLKRWTSLKKEVIEDSSKFAQKIVPMPNTTVKLDELAKDLSSTRLESAKPAIKAIRNWQEAIENQDLANIEKIRKDIGEALKKPELTVIKTTNDKALSSIYSAFKKDMAEYIQKAGSKEDITKWNKANVKLKEMADELDLPILKATLKKGTKTPEEVANMIFSKKPSEVAALYKSLTPDGQASVRSAIIAKAYTQSEGSPDRFAKSLDLLTKRAGNFFTGDDKAQVDGLIKVLKLTERAGKGYTIPDNGAQLVMPLAATGLSSIFGRGLEGFVGSMALTAGGGITARIYESPQVRDALIQLSRVKVNSPEEAALFKRLSEAIITVKKKEDAKEDMH